MPTDIQEQKQQLRKELLFRRRHLDPAVCQAFGRQFAEKIVSLDVYRQAETILCYASCKGEADTWTLIDKAFQDGKKVALPRVDGPASMHFYTITSLEDMIPGYYDIPEPKQSCQEEVFHGLLIVPGTAFDRQMHRMGYGGGFYDAWLERYGTQVMACGLAYDFQLLGNIPYEQHDRMMDLLVTPTSIIMKGDA